MFTSRIKHRQFSHGGRDYHLMDTPGAKRYKKHMISGLVYADAAVLVIDATNEPHFKSHFSDREGLSTMTEKEIKD